MGCLQEVRLVEHLAEHSEVLDDQDFEANLDDQVAVYLVEGCPNRPVMRLMEAGDQTFFSKISGMV